MKKVFYYLLASMLALTLLVACSSDNDDDVKPSDYVEVERPEVDYNKVSAEVSKTELANITASLLAMDANVADFATLFADAKINVNTDEFSVFAIENERDETPDESEVGTRALKVERTKKNVNIQHHIIAGRPNLVTVTADKNYVYKTINGTEIKISKRNNVIYVNGVPMKKNEFYNNHTGKSHIYCIKEELPEETVSASNNEGAYDIKVLNVETGNTANPYTASKDAYVIFFEKDGYNYNLISKVRTNDEGYATLFYTGNKEVYYKASNKGYNYIYKGFQVAGMYLDQKAVDNALPHTIQGPLFQPKVGGIIFADLNNDGVIDYNDKKGTKFLKLNKGADYNTMYLANPAK